MALRAMAVPAPEIATRPKRVEPAVCSLAGVVRLEDAVQPAGRAVRLQERHHGPFGLRSLILGQKRCAPLEEPGATVLEGGQRYPGQVLFVDERPFVLISEIS